MLKRSTAKSEIGVLYRIHVYLVCNNYRYFVPFGITEQLNHLSRQHLDGIPSLLKIVPVQCRCRIHDQQAGFLGLQNFFRPGDYRTLVLKVNRFEQEEPLGNFLGIFSGDLTEPFNGKPFRIDIYDCMILSEAG